MPDLLVLTLAFGVVALAAHHVGRWATVVGLPYITGYLAAGALAGSFGLDLVPTDAVNDLRWIDEAALALIAFVAGSELHVPELRPRLATVRRMSLAVVGIGTVLLVPAVWLVSGFVAPEATVDVRLAVAALGAVVLLALSPPSTIAVVREARASGAFTSTVLSVTILMDVVVVVLFAAATSVAAALLHDAGLDVAFAAVLAVDLLLAVGAGLVVGHALGRLAGSALDRRVAIAAVLLVGYAVYEVMDLLATWSLAELPIELHVEPLLVCMVAGFTVTNRTDFRDAFDNLLHAISPAVYVAFFTLTGIGLKLDVLLDVLPWAAALFAIRLAVLAISGRVAAPGGDDHDDLRRWGWMGLVTQAGIALGLAREATVQFPELGAAFATLVIAVVVLNEVFGPLFLRRALDRVGESRGEGVGSVLVHGLDRPTIAMADRLADDGWDVHLADAHADIVADARASGRRVLQLDGDVIGMGVTLAGVGLTPDVAVLAAADDEGNLQVARALIANDPSVRLVARATGPEGAHAFDDLDAVVIDHTAALTGLLEQAVRTPAAVRLLFPTDGTNRTEEVTVPAGWHDRALRELRLPHDLLVVEVRHGAIRLVPDGFTRVRAGDVLTIVGSAAAVREARTRITAGGGPAAGTTDSRPTARARGTAPNPSSDRGAPAPIGSGSG